MDVLNIPNTLTILRIILIPGFLISLEYGKYDLALYIFIVAAISDGLDGMLARLKDQKTALGAFLDPLADKFMLVSSFILFAHYGWVPEWLTIIIITRDVVVVSGWIGLYLLKYTTKVMPTIFGKSSAFVQFTTIVYVLLKINYGFLPGLLPVLVWLTAAITVVAGMQYVIIGLRMASEKK